MNKLTLACVLVALSACASEPLYTEPHDEAVVDFIASNDLTEVKRIRKYDSDSLMYINGLYVVYRGKREYLLEFRRHCADIKDNSWIPSDYRHDHRYLRARVDTMRGCIIEKIYPITSEQRNELRELGETPGQRL
jgi:hypothetical protein